MTHDSSPVPFWNVNVPPSQHTEHCPDFLEYAFDNAKDRDILATPDDKYVRQTWDDVCRFVSDGRLELFQRVPSDLWRYRKYCAKLVRDHGSIMSFVMSERLHWTDLQAEDGWFENPNNYKILYNDWPYGLDTRIVHLVVWTKFSLSSEHPASDTDPDDLTPEVRHEINRFVDRTFVHVCGRRNVVWFKNWSSLKSIHAVEHFHVMLFSPPSDFVRAITHDDVPMAAKVSPLPKET